MVYPYVKYSDGTEVVFSHIYTDDDGNEALFVHFERPTERGFDSVRITLPDYKIEVWEGNYSKEEIEFFKKIVENSADLFYKYAREGGLSIA